MFPVSEASAKDKKVEGSFESYDQIYSQDYEYSDEFFLQSPDIRRSSRKGTLTVDGSKGFPSRFARSS